ncbi:MAG: hypothetical protein RSC06_00995 [Clostridia bacterium]
MEPAIREARERGEQLIGRKLSDDEFEDALAYAVRKSELQRNGKSYVPLLLPDVIREREYEANSLKAYREARRIEKEEEARWNRLGVTPEQLRKLRMVAPEMIALARSVGLA